MPILAAAVLAVPVGRLNVIQAQVSTADLQRMGYLMWQASTVPTADQKSIRQKHGTFHRAVPVGARVIGSSCKPALVSAAAKPNFGGTQTRAAARLDVPTSAAG